uniref:Alpha-1,3-mannosyl-glycoprotein 2-beta-N-acetylglucosaminyltransferase n=1 Tax=Strongyloides papillosus TaxID=174720 RepID=A0A0N5C7K4_STREA
MQSLHKLIIVVIIVFFSIIFLRSSLSNKTPHYSREKFFESYKHDLQYKLEQLESEVEEEKSELGKLSEIVLNFEKEIKSWSTKKKNGNTTIPVVILTCNRVDGIKHLLSKLVKLRPSAKTFPLYVSQDCDNDTISNMISKEFSDSVTYVKHKSPLKENLSIEKNMIKYKVYYYISRHYKLILKHIFETLKYEAVILLEDDLDISEDFFSYFNATYHQLLKKDKSIYCISAWNDNGLPELIDLKNNNGLYRTDFFPGLGWLMSKDLWFEIGNLWPPGFWDDWIRKPELRKDRSCIRPEISRTSMTVFGKNGASKGYLFDSYLSNIKLNNVSIDFNSLDLSYLRKENYDKYYMNLVYDKSKVVSLDDLEKYINRTNVESDMFLRIEYRTFNEYEKIASYLKIMKDFKEGVGRTAYKGIITTYKNGYRIFLAPVKDEWKGYNRSWEYIP